MNNLRNHLIRLMDGKEPVRPCLSQDEKDKLKRDTANLERSLKESER